MQQHDHTPHQNRVIALYEGHLPGPLIIAVSAIHGNEPSGITAISTLHQMLIAESDKDPDFRYHGTFAGVIANTKASREHKRYIDSDMNRIWSSPINDSDSEHRERMELEKTITDLINKYGNGMVVIMDLHTTSSPRGIFAVPTTNEASKAIALGLHCPIISNMTNYIHGAMIQYYEGKHIGNNEIISVAFEAGRHDDEESPSRAIAAMVNCMRTIGSVNEVHVESKHDEVLKAYANGLPELCRITYIHHIEEGHLWEMQPDISGFQTITKGQLLAHYDGEPVYSPQDGLILMPLYQKQGKEGFFIVEAFELD